MLKHSLMHALSFFKHHRWKISTLVALSITSAVVWYQEVLHHGWHGLIWISYFHWALPFGLVSFVAWAAIMGSFASIKQRVKFVALATVTVPLFYRITENIVRLYFGRGFSHLFLQLISDSYPEPLLWMYAKLYFMVIVVYFGWFAFIPMIVAQLMRWIGVRVSTKTQVVATVLFCSAYPVGLCAIDVLALQGFSDGIHLLKTGAAIPMLMIGLGSLFIPEQDVESVR